MKIIIDYKLDNWNDTIAHNRANRYAGAIRKKKEMDIIKYFLIGKPKITEYPIRIDCTWHIKNINSDLDNKSLKSVLDAMQQVGILENDNIKHIQEINHKAVKDNKDYLELDIKEEI
jgi:Holliday junction resolvase RusA-like endonuclease